MIYKLTLYEMLLEHIMIVAVMAKGNNDRFGNTMASVR